MTTIQDQFANDDTIGQMVSDTVGRNQLLPTGVPDSWDWKTAGRINLGNDPGSFNWAVPWGTVYVAQGEQADPNVMVQVQDITLYVLSKSTGEWTKIAAPEGIAGGLYNQDFAGDTSTPVDQVGANPGSVTAHVGNDDAFQFFFNNYRAELDPNDIAGVIVTYDARIVSEDGSPVGSDDGKYIANAGLDYWSSATSLWAGQDINNRDAFTGSFVPLTGELQKIYGTTLTIDQLKAFPPPAELDQYLNAGSSGGPQLNSDDVVLKIFYDDDGAATSTQLYDADNNLLGVKQVNSDGGATINFFNAGIYTATADVDANGEVRHLSFSNLDGLNYSYDYDATGHLTASGVFDANWTQLGYATYDQDGSVIWSTGDNVPRLDKLPRPLSDFQPPVPTASSDRVDTIQNMDGTVLQVSYKDGDSSADGINLYDAHHNMIASEKFMSDGSREVYLFDDNGNTYIGMMDIGSDGLIAHTSFNADGLNYSYDYQAGVAVAASLFDANWQRLGYVAFDSAGDIVYSDGVKFTVVAPPSVLLSDLDISHTGYVASVAAGADAADNLSVASGADIMMGGTGDDVYTAGNAADVANERDSGGGIDTVQTSSLTLTGEAHIDGAGNQLVNAIKGNAGDIVLDGAGSADGMTGSGGNDVYLVDNVGDTVNERDNGGSGADSVKSSATFTLADGKHAIGNIENLTLAGEAHINGTGNSHNNTVVGNSGVNVLDGGAGNDTSIGSGGKDTLVGGSGHDVFIFDAALGPSNVDKIADFVVADDTIALDHSIFSGLAAGALTPREFEIAASATHHGAGIFDNSFSGVLFYDSDGHGGAAAVHLASLSAHLVLTVSEFTVI